MTRNGKIVLFVSIAAGVGLFLLGWQCHSNNTAKSTGSDTTVRKDSMVFIGVPLPFRVDSLIFVKGKDGKPFPVLVHDTTPGELIVRIDPADTAEIIERLFQVSYYDTTIALKSDTVRVIDTVSFNRITGRQIKIKSQDTTIKITTIKKPPRPLVVSIVASVMGNRTDPLYGYGAGMQLKLPNDETYAIKIYRIPGQKPMIEIEKSWPIRFKKPKK